MAEVSKYFKFLSNPLSLELLQYAQDGIPSQESVTVMSRKQFYGRMAKARKLGLIMKRDSAYRLTAFGEFVLEKARVLGEMNSMEWMFRSIDAMDNEEDRLILIHELFNKRPDIEETLTGRIT